MTLVSKMSLNIWLFSSLFGVTALVDAVAYTKPAGFFTMAAEEYMACGSAILHNYKNN